MLCNMIIMIFVIIINGFTFGGVAVRSVPLGSPIAKEWLSMISSYPASPSSGPGGHSHFYEDAISSPQMRIDKSGEELPEIGDEEEEEIKVFELVRGGNIYSCTMHNNLNFTSREELMKHVSKHTKQHVCEECQKSYASKYNLEAHIVKFHRGVTGVFECTVPGCTVTLKTKGVFINISIGNTSADCVIKFLQVPMN